MPAMTSPFFRTTRWRAGPALSANTVAQNPAGSLIVSSHPPLADVADDLRRPQAAMSAIAIGAMRRTYFDISLEWRCTKRASVRQLEGNTRHEIALHRRPIEVVTV